MRVPHYVEVETSRHCNRSCEWCPNHTIGDRREQQLLPWDHLERVVGSLARIDYRGWFAFHNYNEPLTNPRIVEEVRFVRERLPSARSTIFTNGDRLTEKLFSALVAAGLAQMRITVYPKKTRRDAASHLALKAWLARRSFLRDKPWAEIPARQGPTLSYSGPPELILISPNVDQYYDRGGTVPWLSIESRKAPCALTSHSLSIDYLGNVKMCCNVVSGRMSHRDYLIGNVADDDPLELWNSPAMEDMRQRHRRADWDGTPICKSCRQELKQDPPSA